MAGNAFGWYGPLIDLADAASHVGSYVQLLVFVRASRPVQRFKASNGGELVRTDVHVGDDTRSYFSICVWQKQMGEVIFAGDVVLIQNVKIVKFGGALEATTVPSSSLLLLVRSHQLLASRGIEELLIQSRVGTGTKGKLGKVLSWAQATGPKLHCTNYPISGWEVQRKNWKVHQDQNLCECISILEILNLAETCRALFYGSIGEICLPFNMNVEGDFEVDKLFVSKRLFKMGDSKTIDDFICLGCKLCGSPVDPRIMETKDPLYCEKSTNHLHDICSIYRPFLLYVWDQSAHIPLLVKNKAAEIFFGNVTAENINECYKGKRSRIDFCKVWLILLKLSLQQGKNSPLKFEININCDRKSGRFELITVKMPCNSRKEGSQ
ncbi:hypothetical protein H6P81_010984 [Aristolochia fimbriata]|uniref:Uncharacterized protein n=1 Tax=Aristolochia fimbriata TaxID=158543 RepID=A0AAV7EQZ5_ARIFI|nr:hypothetical protein H6P81_010984 [Aristolochia fimbriata]